MDIVLFVGYVGILIIFYIKEMLRDEHDYILAAVLGVRYILQIIRVAIKICRTEEIDPESESLNGEEKMGNQSILTKISMIPICN